MSNGVVREKDSEIARLEFSTRIEGRSLIFDMHTGDPEALKAWLEFKMFTSPEYIVAKASE